MLVETRLMSGRNFFSLPLSVCPFRGLKQIAQRALESFDSIFSRPRGFSLSFLHLSRELFEVGVKLIEPRLNPDVKLVQFRFGGAATKLFILHMLC